MNKNLAEELENTIRKLSQMPVEWLQETGLWGELEEAKKLLQQIQEKESEQNDHA